jgi:hypothetical protein
MVRSDATLKVILLVIALLLGMIALRPWFEPAKVLAEPAKFDHVFIVATTFLYKGTQGLLVLDKRNGNVWFIPKGNDSFGDPVFVIRMQFEKLDKTPE